MAALQDPHLKGIGGPSEGSLRNSSGNVRYQKRTLAWGRNTGYPGKKPSQRAQALYILECLLYAFPYLCESCFQPSELPQALACWYASLSHWILCSNFTNRVGHSAHRATTFIISSSFISGCNSSSSSRYHYNNNINNIGYIMIVMYVNERITE